MKRRTFIAGLGSAAAWPVMARAQQPTLPVIALINDNSSDGAAPFAAGFRKGLGEAGYFDGQNVIVEYHWLAGRLDSLPNLVAELVRRSVTVIAAPLAPAVVAAKAATPTIPIVFGVAQDPVRLGLVASLARPGGNATGLNFLAQEINAKRLDLLHQLVPKAGRIAVLVNPLQIANTEAILSEVQEAAKTIKLQLRIIDAGTIGGIEDAFATMAAEHADALFVSGDGFFASRRVQFATLAAHNRIPAAYAQRDFVEVGGLLSYGPDIADMFRQVGLYCANILKGAKPADLPVLQSSKLTFVVNLQTARALRIEVPPALLAITDEVIE